jgi:hypothetical protein
MSFVDAPHGDAVRGVAQDGMWFGDRGLNKPRVSSQPVKSRPVKTQTSPRTRAAIERI